MKNKTLGKRILSLALVLVMFAGFVPVMETEAEAAGDEGWYIPVDTTWFGCTCEKKHSDWDYFEGFGYCVITSGYGKREKPTENASSMHYGIDIGGSKSHGGIAGANVYAVKSGVVDSASYISTSGNTIVLKHNVKGEIYYTKYEHLSKMLVAEGDPIKQGQTIGYVGSTGNASTGAHLDFRILKGGKNNSCYIDPTPNVNVKYKKVLCDHSTSTYDYTTYGFCTDCGSSDYENSKWSWNTSCASSEMIGEEYYIKPAKNKVESPLRNAPYDWGEVIPPILAKGTHITVIGSLKNNLGHLWYKAKTDEGKIGYIYSENVEKKPINISYNCVPQTIHNSITEGSSEHIQGEINVDGAYIQAVRGYFAKAGDEDVEIADTGVIPLNSLTHKYSLNKSALDTALKFGKLSSGVYCFAVEATLNKKISENSNTLTFYSNYFTVVGNTVSAPALTEQSLIYGGRYYALTGAGTIYYSVNGGAYAPYTSPLYFNSSATIEAYCTVNGKNSTHLVRSVTVPTISAPNIISTLTDKGATIQLTADAGSELYYSINNDSLSIPYTGPFTVAESCTVYARAQRVGYITSESSQNITVSAPGNFSISLNNTEKDIAVGSTATISWPNVPLASEYYVTVSKGYRVPAQEFVTQPQFSVSLNEEGTYTLEVEACNAIGWTAASNKITVTAHEPSTVTFVDWDDTVIEEQTVRYGFDAVTPESVPSRRGHTFTGWSGSYYNVKSDLTIKANYTRNRYNVSFLDYDGTPLTNSSVYFGDPVDTSAAEALVTLKTGYAFGGWLVQKAADDSDRDLTFVDSNMEVIAVTGWENADLPVVVTNLSATSYYDASRGQTTGYYVNFDISSIPDYDTKAKLVASLYGSDNSMLAVGVTTINSVADNQNENMTVFVSYDKNDTVRPASVQLNILSVDGADRTGGMIAETARCIPTVDSADETAWSEWSTELPAGKSAADQDVQSRTIYRGRQNTQTTTSNTTGVAPAGFTLSGTSESWGSWSGWLDYPVTASATRKVETQQVSNNDGYTMYRYGRYERKTSHYYTFSEKAYSDKSSYKSLNPFYSAWSTTQIAPTKLDAFSAYENNSAGTGVYKNGKYYWNTYMLSSNANHIYYWEERMDVPSTSRTQYRYCDKITTYHYIKWTPGDWSDWSTEPKYSSADGSYTAEAQTEYRYVIAEQPTTSNVTQRIVNFDGSKVSGDPSLLATVMVYRSQNTDPTESQLEFVGQTTLGSVNGYTYKPKEEPTTGSGDYIVALAVEGYDGLINIGTVKAPKHEYVVNYYSADGETLLLSETVEEGSSVTAPEAPQIDGMMFVGWSAVAVNVSANLDILAVYAPYSYAVVYVDYLNQTCELKRVEGGLVLAAAEDVPSHEGYSFDGWFKADGTPISEGDTVTTDMIITAKWTPNVYTVTFCNADGSTFTQQQVAYGDAAELPGAPELPENTVFLGWSESSKWWDVTSDLTIYPITAYTSSATLTSNLGEYCEAVSEILELYSDAEATIYYTLDGSEPDPANVGKDDPGYEQAIPIHNQGDYGVVWEDTYNEGVTYIYTEPLELTEECFVTARASAPDMNDSQTIYIEFYPVDYAVEDDIPETVDLETYNAYVNPGETVEITVALPDEIALQSFLFYIDADPSVFFVPYDDTLDDGKVVAGELCDSGYFIHSGYSDGLGWKILWVSIEPTENSGTLFTMTLQASEEAEAGVYPIKVRYSPYNTVTSEDISLSETDFEATIGDCGGVILGDVNGNGYITTADVIRIARYVIDDIVLDERALIAADVTCDGNVTNADVIRLAKYIIGIAEIG